MIAETVFLYLKTQGFDRYVKCAERCAAEFLLRLNFILGQIFITDLPFMVSDSLKCECSLNFTCSFE